MEIPKDVLDFVIESTNNNMENYVRKQYHSDEVILWCANFLYDENKNIKWVNNIYEIKKIINVSEKPWAYHYSLNINWVLFFISLFEHIQPYLNEEDFEDMLSIYIKVTLLKNIFDHIDGIIEDGDTIYLVKTDVNFIKTKLDRWIF